MPLFAGDVKLNDSLRLGAKPIRNKAQGGLEAALQGLGERQSMSQRATGTVPGVYAPGALERAGQTAELGIDDRLLAALGGASYDEMTKQKEHDQNLALAHEIGSLNQPNSIQEILAALGSAAKSGAGAYALYQGKPGSSGATPNANGSLSPALSLYGERSGYGRYQ